MGAIIEGARVSIPDGGFVSDQVGDFLDAVWEMNEDVVARIPDALPRVVFSGVNGAETHLNREVKPYDGNCFSGEFRTYRLHYGEGFDQTVAIHRRDGVDPTKINAQRSVEDTFAEGTYTRVAAAVGIQLGVDVTWV